MELLKERIGTLKEMMNYLLVSASAPDNLWDEAILYVCHLQNIIS